MAQTIVSFDWAISGLLRDKANFDVLSGFLSELLGREVEVLELVEGRSNPDGWNYKKNRLNLRAKINGDETAIFEMQVGTENDILQRILFGVSNAVTEQLVRRDPPKIEKIYSVGIIFYESNEGGDCIYHGRTVFNRLPNLDRGIGDIFLDYYLIYPNRFNGEINCPLDEWLYTLKKHEVNWEFTAAGIQAAGKKLNVQKMTNDQLYEEEVFVKARRVRSCEMESAIEKNFVEERHLWQDIVADKDTALAKANAELAELKARLGGTQ